MYQYYVKLKERSYRDCRWVSEVEMDRAQAANTGVKMKLNNFRNQPGMAVYLQAQPVGPGKYCSPHHRHEI